MQHFAQILRRFGGTYPSLQRLKVHHLQLIARVQLAVLRDDEPLRKRHNPTPGPEVDRNLLVVLVVQLQQLANLEDLLGRAVKAERLVHRLVKVGHRDETGHVRQQVLERFQLDGRFRLRDGVVLVELLVWFAVVRGQVAAEDPMEQLLAIVTEDDVPLQVLDRGHCGKGSRVHRKFEACR
uniref:(northern house mosquito) hypothetical protein n=1 Tax=Culex pipiens TaxID=7175 RepID=A0A8D8JZ97_CULPI